MADNIAELDVRAEIARIVLMNALKDEVEGKTNRHDYIQKNIEGEPYITAGIKTLQETNTDLVNNYLNERQFYTDYSHVKDPIGLAALDAAIYKSTIPIGISGMNSMSEYGYQEPNVEAYYSPRVDRAYLPNNNSGTHEGLHAALAERYPNHNMYTSNPKFAHKVEEQFVSNLARDIDKYGKHKEYPGLSNKIRKEGNRQYDVYRQTGKYDYLR